MPFDRVLARHLPLFGAPAGLCLLALRISPADAAVTCGTPDSTNASVCSIDPTINAAALCNDGTLPVFWVRPGSGAGAATWVIWLEGGGQCTDKLSCAVRARRSSSAGNLTSNGFTAVNQVGVLSPSAKVNPMLYNANVAYLHYCSSDDWSGAYTSGVAFDGSDPTTWNFQGRQIALAAVKSLGELSLNLAGATTIVLGGSSAGAEGVTVTANDILPLLPSAAAVRLVNDAGFALDIGQYDSSVAAPYIYTGEPNAFYDNFEQALNLWHGRGDAKCAASATTLSAQIACYDSAGLLQQGYIAVPSFVAESQIDTAQLSDQLCPSLYGHCSVPTSPSSMEGQYATAFGQHMAAALQGSGTPAAYAVASPDAYMHVILEDEEYFLKSYATASGSTRPRDVFDEWLANPNGARIVSLGTGPGVQ